MESSGYPAKFLAIAVKLLEKYNEYDLLLHAITRNLIVFKTLKKVHPHECKYIVEEMADLKAAKEKENFVLDTGKSITYPDVGRECFFATQEEIMVFHEIMSRNEKNVVNIKEEICNHAMRKLKDLTDETKKAMRIMIKCVTAHKLRTLNESIGK
jgi:hypothetical protein